MIKANIEFDSIKDSQMIFSDWDDLGSFLHMNREHILEIKASIIWIPLMRQGKDEKCKDIADTIERNNRKNESVENH